MANTYRWLLNNKKLYCLILLWLYFLLLENTTISELYVFTKKKSPSIALWKCTKQAAIQSFAKHCHKFFIWQLTFSLVFLAAIGTFSKKGAGEKYLV